MEDIKTIFNRMDESIRERGYELITSQLDLDAHGDNLFEYIRLKSPQGIISGVWNSDREYFMLQHSYKGKINPAMFMIRFRDLRDEEELMTDMDSMFRHWKK